MKKLFKRYKSKDVLQNDWQFIMFLPAFTQKELESNDISFHPGAASTIFVLADASEEDHTYL